MFVSRDQGEELTKIENLINMVIPQAKLEGFEPNPPPADWTEHRRAISRRQARRKPVVSRFQQVYGAKPQSPTGGGRPCRTRRRSRCRRGRSEARSPSPAVTSGGGEAHFLQLGSRADPLIGSNRTTDRPHRHFPQIGFRHELRENPIFCATNVTVRRLDECRAERLASVAIQTARQVDRQHWTPAHLHLRHDVGEWRPRTGCNPVPNIASTICTPR